MRGFWSRALEVLLAFHREESAQDLIEYALIASLIALGALVSMNSLAAVLNNGVTNVAGKFHRHIGKHLGQSK